MESIEVWRRNWPPSPPQDYFVVTSDGVPVAAVGPLSRLEVAYRIAEQGAADEVSADEDAKSLALELVQDAAIYRVIWKRGDGEL